jgi:hypothetical protein
VRIQTTVHGSLALTFKLAKVAWLWSWAGSHS